jgi:hypothetical protein
LRRERDSADGGAGGYGPAEFALGTRRGRSYMVRGSSSIAVQPPLFFVSVASKGVRVWVSSLSAILTKGPVSVDSKVVTGRI